MTRYYENGDGYNDADVQSKHQGAPYFNHRRFMPFYNDKADYNTSSFGYYDFLARPNYYWRIIMGTINRLLRRDIQVQDTNTINMNKIGDWEQQDDTTLDANVKLSKHVENNNKLGKLTNAITAYNDGLYSANLIPIVSKLVDALASSGSIEVPREVPLADDKLIKGVDLGKVTNTTRVEITARLGSTRQTQSFTVGDLKGSLAHLLMTNLGDGTNTVNIVESYTKVIDNKLMITTIKQIHMTASNNWSTYTTPEDMSVYYEKQNPDYINQINSQEQGPNILRVRVMDLVPIFS